MNYDLLNNMVNYIEDNLLEDIDYKKLSKIVGVSNYTLQGIFIFLTGISISEYIRKRRLSRAYEELKTSNIKIIDLAIKYNYNSPISFSRAFKQYFNLTPTECRQSHDTYKLFPVMKFQNTNYYNHDINYEIKEIDEKILYCFKVTSNYHDDLLFKIRKLYDYLEQEGIHSKLNEIGMYGISKEENDEYQYYVGSEMNLDDTEKIIIEKGKYAVFEVGSREQEDIVKVYDFVYNVWLKSTDYILLDKPEIELYEYDNCYIYFKVEYKQN